jgi:DNA-binding CsgD family transcriptional regulator
MWIEKMEKKALQNRISETINTIAPMADQLPGVVIIHALPDFSVQYISERGARLLGKTRKEIEKMSNKEYHERFFNAEDAVDYVPKITGLLERNTDEVVSFFQQVRTSETQEFDWYMSTIKILMRDDCHKPLLTITLAMQIDPKHHITSKVTRLLEENNFLRRHYHQFSKITKREQEVLKCIALGKTTAEFAKELHISVATAETHRKNIKRKLDIRSSYHLSLYARAFDLI